MEDIIIIGAGPIGIYAAYLASLHQLSGRIIEGMDAPGGQLTSLYPEKLIIDLAGFGSIQAKDFIDRLLRQHSGRENALPICLNERVLRFERIAEGYAVITSEGTYQTKTILVASGMGVFQPRKIGLENEDTFQNVIYSLKHTGEYENKSVAILGGGDSAVDWALTLQSIAKKVFIIHRRNEFRAQSASVAALEKSSVTVLKPYTVTALKGRESVESVVLTHCDTAQTVEIDVDVVFVNYGMIAAPCAFPIETKGTGFAVRSDCMTSAENVFAVGNAAVYEGKVKNITAGFGEAVTAVTRIDQIIHPGKNIPHF